MKSPPNEVMPKPAGVGGGSGGGGGGGATGGDVGGGGGGGRCPPVAAGRQQQACAKEQDGHQTPSPGGGRPAGDRFHGVSVDFRCGQQGFTPAVGIHACRRFFACRAWLSMGFCNRATGDRQNRATDTGPPGAGLRDRTPTTPNAVRRAFAAGTRLRRARTSGGLPGSVVNARSSRLRPAGERRRPLLSQGGAPCGARRGTPNPAGLRGIGPRGDVRSPGDGFGSSRWWNPGERRERPVLPVGARRPADKAREGGAPTGRTGPGVFRPKRNDERRAATRFSRDGSAAEPPPGELGRAGFITGCWAGMDRRPNAARVSPPAGKPARDGSEFPDSDISGFPRPPAGRDGGCTRLRRCMENQRASEVPGGGPFANPAGFENQVSEIRGQRTSRPGRETGCR